MTTKLKRKHAGRKKGGIRKHKFAMCAKRCKGSRNYRGCMSTCLKG